MKHLKLKHGLAIGIFSCSSLAFAQQPQKTQNYINKFSSTLQPINSQLYDNGTSVILGGTSAIGGENFGIQGAVNAATFQRIYNNTLGNAASVNYVATANGAGISMSAYNTSYTSSGIYQAGTGVLNSPASNGMNIGTNSNTQLSFWTNNTKKMTITNTGDVWINTGNQISIKGGDMNHGLGYYDATTGFAGVPVDGPALYGWAAGMLGTNQNGVRRPALRWDLYGQVTTYGQGLNTKVVMGSANGASLNYGTSYIGLNASRDQSTLGWTRYSDGANNGGSVVFGGVDGSINFSPMPSISGTANKTFTDADVIANQVLRIRWNNAISGTYKGQVQIGSQLPGNAPYNSALLSVSGMMVAKEIWVVDQTTGGWADYVFAANYPLQKLSEVEQFIKENKHLPNVPSAEEIANKGQNIGKLQVTQMEKIEELTLYLIEMNKNVTELSKKVEVLQKENETLKNCLK